LANQARLQLFALAYDLGNFLRRLALPKPVRHWSLTTLREKLIKIGAKVTRHSKYVTFQLAEVAVARNLFAAILNRIARLAIGHRCLRGMARKRIGGRKTRLATEKVCTDPVFAVGKHAPLAAIPGSQRSPNGTVDGEMAKKSPSTRNEMARY
jgi:hypothetical protein